MEQIRKVLAPTDLTEFSKIGVRYALTLAKVVGADVTGFHVVDYEDPADYESVIREKMKENASNEGVAQVLPRMVKAAFEHYGEVRAASSYYAPVSSLGAA